MKEYLVKNMYGDYVLTDQNSGFNVEDLIEVPEGAEMFLLDTSLGKNTLYFVKHDGKVFHEHYISGSITALNKWLRGTIERLHEDMGYVLWKRNSVTTNSVTNGLTTPIQDKLKFIEKWLNGEKIQYILGEETDKSQWHNLAEGAMQYIKRSDIKFREAPKYVTINGFEFKSIEILLKYVKNNFDLEEGFDVQ